MCESLSTDFSLLQHPRLEHVSSTCRSVCRSQNKADLTRCAEEILLAREAHFPATIADLYDPEHMPADLRAAHDRNDETLERIYIGRRFKNDTERLEKLFELYTADDGSTKLAAGSQGDGGDPEATGAKERERRISDLS